VSSRYRRSVAAAVLSAGILVGAAAAAERSVSMPGTIAGVNADGGRLAYLDAASSGDCGGLRVWTLSTRATPRLNGKAWCPAGGTSTGTGLVGPGLAGSRAVWVSFVGGNLREWTLWTSVPGAPSPKLIRTIARDVDTPGPFAIGAGDQDLLPYGQDAQVIAMRANGARRFAWNAPSRVAAVAAGSGRVAVLLAAGPVVVLSNAGAVVERHEYAAGALRAVRTSGSDLVVRTAAGIDRWSSGARTGFSLPAGAALEDVVGGIVVYTRGGDVRGLRLSDGADVLLRSTGASTARAQLESDSGLFVATGKSVVYALTWAQVQARFAA
jgi:hypothetical protein